MHLEDLAEQVEIVAEDRVPMEEILVGLELPEQVVMQLEVVAVAALVASRAMHPEVVAVAVGVEMQVIPAIPATQAVQHQPRQPTTASLYPVDLAIQLQFKAAVDLLTSHGTRSKKSHSEED